MQDILEGDVVAPFFREKGQRLLIGAVKLVPELDGEKKGQDDQEPAP